MTSRLLAIALVAGLMSSAAVAADDDNPYKNAKVGDSATYNLTMKVANQELKGTVTQTVTAKSDKEVTVKVTGKIADNDIPVQEQKIDLTKPFNPGQAGPGGLPPGVDLKVEKGKEGKEKIKLAGKEYEANWTEYKVKGKAMGIDIDMDSKVWIAKEVPMGVAKMTMNSSIAGMTVEMTMELAEPGKK
jgi:hypothetical protein